MAEPLVQRHYPVIDGLVRRTQADVSREASEAQLAARAALGLDEGGPVSPRLVSSAHGRLERMLLTIPAYAVQESGGLANPLAAAYRDLVAKLPGDLSWLVLTHRSVEDEVRTWFEGRQLDLVTMRDHLHFSVWAEDGYVAVEDADSGETVLVEPFEFPRYGDALIADAVANGSDLEHSQAPLYFQGGNVLVGDDFFLIGADYPANTLRYIGRVLATSAGEAPATEVLRLYREYLDTSRDLHVVGSTIPVLQEQARPIEVAGEPWTEFVHLGNGPGTAQPLFHIDMFLTLAGRDSSGRYRILVGDPSRAADLLGVPLWPHALQEVFDNVAQGLARLGFAVIRNPLPLAYVDDPARRERTWYYATANNALVQIADDSRRVWLPAYGFGGWSALEVTDEANVELWRSLGFEPTLLTDFHPFAENLGSVHCIKKYLARSG